VPEVVGERKTHVFPQQIDGVLNLLDALSDHVIGNPLLELAGFEDSFVLALRHMEDEADVVENDDSLGKMSFVFDDRKLRRAEGERSGEDVLVLLGDEILKKTVRLEASFFHSNSRRPAVRPATAIPAPNGRNCSE
jgi:hypothetical protein